MGSIELTNDHGWMISVLNDSEMFDRISADGQDFRFDYAVLKWMEDNGYLLGWRVDNRLRGFYWIQKKSEDELEIHVHFPKNARQYAKHSGESMLKWLQNNVPKQYKRFTAMIPLCFPDVIGFAVREGLNRDEVIKDHIVKGGKSWDVQKLSINREDV